MFQQTCRLALFKSRWIHKYRCRWMLLLNLMMSFNMLKSLFHRLMTINYCRYESRISLLSNDVMIDFNTSQEEDCLRFAMVVADEKIETCVQGRIDLLNSYLSTKNESSKKLFFYHDDEYRLRWCIRRNSATLMHRISDECLNCLLMWMLTGVLIISTWIKRCMCLIMQDKCR